MRGTEGVDHDRQRLGNADGVGQLDFAAVGQTGGDHVLCDPARGIRGGAVDLGAVLAAKGAAAVTAVTAVGVDDDLAAGEARVAHGTANDKASGGVHIDVGVVPRHVLGGHDGSDDVLDEVGLDLAHVLDLGGVLRGDDDSRDLDGLAVLVAHRDLGLAVGAQVAQGSVVAHGGQSLGQAARQVVRHGHEGLGLVGGIAKHHALVAGADQVDGVGGGAGLGLERLVDALGDIGRLLVDEVHDAAGIAVKTELCAVVANAADNATGNLLYVDVGLGADLAGNDDGTGGHKGLAGAADVLNVGGHAVGRNVALLLQLYFFSEDCVEDGIADLVGDLIGMTFGHRLRRKYKGPVLGWDGTKFFWHDSPFQNTCPGDRYHSAELSMQGHIIARKSNIHTLSAPTHWGQT